VLWKTRKSTSRRRSAELVSQAQQLAAGHRHEDALEVLTRCLQQDGDDVPALLTIIQIQAHLGRYDEALDSSLRVLKIDAANRPVLASIAQLVSHPGLTRRYPEIFQVFHGRRSDRPGARVAADGFSELAPVLVARANQMFAAGSHADAIGVLEQCASLLPDSAPAQLALAQIRVHHRQDREALALCLRAMDADPASQTAISILEQLVLRTESEARAEAAEALYTAISRYVSAGGDAAPVLSPLMSLIGALSAWKDHRKALDAARMALKAAPDSQAVNEGLYRIISDPELSDDASAFAAAAFPDLMARYSATFKPTADERDAYDRLATLNVVETLASVIRRFHRELETDSDVPLMRFLAAARQRLADGRDPERPPRWVLLRFEMAWRSFLKGESESSIALLRTIVGDSGLQTFASCDPFAKEALVRAGEILGRYEERAGRIDSAMSIYYRTMQLQENALVARRMALLHWRRGNIEEAMTAAESAIMTKPNLFPGLQGGPHMTRLREELLWQEKVERRMKDGEADGR